MSEEKRYEYLAELENQISASGVLPPGIAAPQAISAVLCTLSTRLNRGEAIDLLNSLPKNVSSLFERCATHRGDDHGFTSDADQFFRIVGEHLRMSNDQAEDLTRIVFKTLRNWIPEKEFKDIESELSKDLKRVWRAA